jgi:hypothetical protein
LGWLGVFVCLGRSGVCDRRRGPPPPPPPISPHAHTHHLAGRGRTVIEGFLRELSKLATRTAVQLANAKPARSNLGGRPRKKRKRIRAAQDPDAPKCVGACVQLMYCGPAVRLRLAMVLLGLVH